MIELKHGDCLEVLRTMPDNSVDSIVTDPPYGLAFMGKKWDYDVPSEDIWRECLRVLKPGGYLLAFAGTRTQHRMAVRIEDAGFEIRDMIAWVYGSGFPKSLDVSKAIDKCNGETGRLLKFTEWMRTTGITARQVDKITGTNMGDHYLTAASQPAIPTPALWALLRPHCGDVPEWVDQLVQRIEAEREVVGKHTTDMGGLGGLRLGQAGGAITAPATPAARQWQGWGTALKPALEPITVARKPFPGTVADNVQEWGAGGINVDGCRVGGEVRTWRGMSANMPDVGTFRDDNWTPKDIQNSAVGRWPANFIHDGSDEVTGLFPQQAAGSHAQKPTHSSNAAFGGGRYDNSSCYGDTGSAARFFYCAKASKRDRDEGCEGFDEKQPTHGRGHEKGGLEVSNAKNTKRNHHPTVKPTDLMRYLCRLVTPPGGVVLDPFMGSGSTGKAAVLERFDFIGIDREAEYVEIARCRIAAAEKEIAQKLPL